MKLIRLLFTALLLFSSRVIFSQEDGIISGSKATGPNETGYPVILRGDTLLFVRASLGPFSAKERAKALSSRLDNILKDSAFEPDSLYSTKVDNDYYIIYKNKELAVIGQKDTIGTGMSMEESAALFETTVRSKMVALKERFRMERILSNIGYTLLVLAVMIVIIWLLTRIFRWIFNWMERSKGRIFKGVKLHNYEFLTVEREHAFAVYFLKFIKIVLVIVLFLVALPVIFSIFPATEGITKKIIALVWSPVRNILMAVVNYLPKLVTIIIIYIIFSYLIKFIRFLALEVERKVLVIPGFHPDWAKSTYNIIRLLLYAFMFVVIFPYLPGSDSAVFRGVSVFLGILISLGSTTLIGNIMAGLVITYMRPYKVGDRIKINDIMGDVTEKSLMITRVRTIKNEDVTIPNSTVLTGYTVNYSTPTEEKEGLIIHTTVTIGYDAPWRTVHKLLISAALETSGVVRKPQPFVLQTSLDDFYVSYQINAYIKESHTILRIKSDLHQNIQDQFNKAGVEIMSPHYRSERDGNEITIPKNWESGVPHLPVKKEDEDKPAKKKKRGIKE